MSTRFGRYVVIRPLGTGSFGEVFLARDPELERDVAIKVVRRDQLGGESLELLLREARAVAALRHPHLVAVFDVGGDRDGVWVVMEFVPGETLRVRLDRGPLALAEVVRLGRALCEALSVAHARGVIHRDLKPENVLLTVAGDPRLADFGIARAPGSRTLTDSGAVVGTLLYMSPEQAMGEAVDARTDLFSLAVVLYEALAGRHPFRRESEVATLYAILNEHPEPPPAGAGLDERVRAFFRRALAKDAVDRYPDASAFAADLARLLERIEEGAAPSGEGAGDPAARRESRLVGRDAELRGLVRRLERLRVGGGGTVLVAGEAGIGKSRLLAEAARVAERQHARVLRGRALLEGGPAYHPWSQILTQAFGGPGPARIEGLERFLSVQPGFAGARAASLRRLLHLESSARDDVSDPNQIWEAAVATLQALAAERPLLVLLDDLHWADQASLQLFRFAAAHARGRKWLLVGAYRPEESEGDDAPVTLGGLSRLMGRDEEVWTVRLGRLDRAATAEMVGELLGREVSGSGLEERIFGETEGNPLFVIETARLIEETGGRLEDFVIPARVVDVLEHRLDRLTRQDRDALEVAAVEGEFFHVAAIATVLEVSRVKALKLLQRLERDHRLVRPAERSFRFDHGKIREVILARIGSALRREYHRIVAACLLEEEDRATSATLALHLSEAGENEAALPYRLLAAAEARAVFANEEALRHLAAALATLEAGGAEGEVARKRASVRLDMAEIRLRTGGYAAAAEIFERVANDRSAALPGALRARAVLGAGECAFAQARYDEAWPRIEEARTLAEDAGEPGLLTRIHVALARVHTRRGEFDAALAACARSEAIARELGDERHRVHSLLESGDICLRRGAFAEARGHFEAARSIAERGDDLAGQARAIGSLATVARETGDFAAALDLLERSGELCRRMGDPQGEARALANRGNVHLNRGEWEAARRCYEPALRSFRALGERHAEGIVLNNMSLALSGGGDYEAASKVVTECLALMRELGDRWETAGVLDNLGVLEHRRGRAVDARRLLGEAVDLRRALGDRARLADSLLSLALVEESLLDNEAAIACAREALAAAGGEPEAEAAARGLLALYGGAAEASDARAAAEAMRAAALKARERGDAELAVARMLPAGELLARLGDWSAVESLAREQAERSRDVHMVYEEAWARTLLARACLAAGRHEEALNEARLAASLAAGSDLRGALWKAAAWLADAGDDDDPTLVGSAVADLESYVSTFGDERGRHLRAGATREKLERWRERSRARGDAATLGRLEELLP